MRDGLNILFFGDNLDVLRHQVGYQTVDLIYLDPPFNSNACYSAIFTGPANGQPPARIAAFDDAWHWNLQVQEAFDQVTTSDNVGAAAMLRAMRSVLHENDMMAYLAMMAVRLMEMHRVLKPTGTLYLHCDATSSHYLKILLDAIFGPAGWRNEIIWKRSNPKSHVSTNFPTCTDTILRYCKGPDAVYRQPYEAHDPDYVARAYRYRDGRGIYRLLPLLNPNDDRPNLTYEFLGVTRVWRWTRERMQKAYDDGLVVQRKSGAVPQYKKYLDESKGRTVTNCWTDIPQAAGGESLGYPTQKPMALLERIIAASSNEGDVVLDPFCGSGTALHAAQKLRRSWIGIDMTPIAIDVVKRRLSEAFPEARFEMRGVAEDNPALAGNAALRLPLQGGGRSQSGQEGSAALPHTLRCRRLLRSHGDPTLDRPCTSTVADVHTSEVPISGIPEIGGDPALPFQGRAKRFRKRGGEARR
jgi:site-specific DNA-methyltransferase (adenine-specific)